MPQSGAKRQTAASIRKMIPEKERTMLRCSRNACISFPPGTTSWSPPSSTL